MGRAAALGAHIQITFTQNCPRERISAAVLLVTHSGYSLCKGKPPDSPMFCLVLFVRYRRPVLLAAPRRASVEVSCEDAQGGAPGPGRRVLKPVTTGFSPAA